MFRDDKSRTNPKVDEFLGKAKNWKEEYETLRNIVLNCELTEEFKWMHPVTRLRIKTSF